MALYSKSTKHAGHVEVDGRDVGEILIAEAVAAMDRQAPVVV